MDCSGGTSTGEYIFVLYYAMCLYAYTNRFNTTIQECEIIVSNQSAKYTYHVSFTIEKKIDTRLRQ